MATDRHAEFLGLWATFAILTTVIVALRFYVRIAGGSPVSGGMIMPWSLPRHVLKSPDPYLGDR